MSQGLDHERVTLPERRSVVSTYSGPRSGLGGATRAVYAWVGTYFRDRVGDVTVGFDMRPADLAKPDPTEIIGVEIRFDVDDDFPLATKLPQGLKVHHVPREEVLIHSYEGPLTGMNADIIPWMTSAAREYVVRPGYRHRMKVTKKKPTDDGWVIEAELVLR